MRYSEMSKIKVKRPDEFALFITRNEEALLYFQS